MYVCVCVRKRASGQVGGSPANDQLLTPKKELEGDFNRHQRERVREREREGESVIRGQHT